ncbi:protein kinase [Actinoplanes sp. LDG1-06]|uniref:Protein kinase n=1 Tax=Paractinoplanes ovalisporus TaxID=2810368 RepID=A0ABS2AQD8_9ACTN|nr:serine/threonine-protein kinase [Actinoplanes ovalisporus]MBM2622021.1 protein kinase [Actinoplanes ovalisporus]
MDPATIGRYEIERRLGSGGMGTVFLGRTPGGRPAAVKVINPGYLDQPEALDRFRREAETLRTVRNAYVAALIDCELDEPPFWFATEYVPGPTLAAAIDTNGPAPATDCRTLMAALAEALADVHAHGICHRDVKPQNVILSPTGPRLIDFGIARGLAETGLTNSVLAVGTPGYTAPELFNGEPLSPAADVFALGATLAHAATARKPYGVGTLESIWMRSMREDIDLDGVDPQLAALIRWCVARDPDARPAPAQIVEWCRQWRQNGEVTVRVPTRPPEPTVEPTPARRSRRPLTVAAAALTLLLVFASGALASRRLFPPDSPPPSPPAAMPAPRTEDGRCIEKPPDDADGARLNAVPCADSPTQRWTFTREGALQFPGTTRCLDTRRQRGRRPGRPHPAVGVQLRRGPDLGPPAQRRALQRPLRQVPGNPSRRSARAADLHRHPVPDLEPAPSLTPRAVAG